MLEWGQVPMQINTVNSTAIHAIGYDPELRVMEIVFNTGRIYQFVNVPPEEYERLKEAESKGQAFNLDIRDTYSYWSLHAPRQSRARRGAAWSR